MFRVAIKITIILAVFLMLSRLVFLVLFPEWYKQSLSFADWFAFFLTSFKFDLMVIGYLLSPLIIAAIPFLFLKRNDKWNFVKIYRGYIFFLVILLSYLSIVDFNHFASYADRLSLHTYKEALRFGFTKGGIFYLSIIVFLLLAYRTFKVIDEVIFESIVNSGWVKWFLWLLLNAAMMRGSFSSLHLDLRHAQVTPSQFMNKMIVPSAYALDQAFRGRR